MLYEEIEAKVTDESKGEYRSSKLTDLVTWLGTDVMLCLSNIYAGGAEGGEADAKRMLKPTFARFEYHLYKSLGQLRWVRSSVGRKSGERL